MKTKWDLKQMYLDISDSNIQKDIERSKKIISSFVKKWNKDKGYLKSSKKLKQALDEYEKIFSDIGICNKPIYFLTLLNQLDQTNTKIKGELNKVQDICTKLENDIQFFELEISKVDSDRQRIFLKSKDLKEYKHFLEQLFKSSKFLLSDKEEKVFNLTSKTGYGNWVDMITELLDKQETEILNEDGKKSLVSYNEIPKYLNSTKKRVRSYASKKFNDINERYTEVAEFEINSILEHKKVNDEYRRIDKPDLPRHLSDDIDSSVVDTLIDVVSSNFDISKKYYQYKAKQMGVTKLGYHERNVPLGDIDIEYSYKESMDIVKRTFGDIDKEFSDIVNGFQENGQYDVYPNKGKSGGAFCITMSKSLPSYILLNHKNKLDDVLTIAHESGHGIHSVMSRKQNSLNSGHPTSLAEVASTFFEDFVLEEILKGSDEKLRYSILNKRINDDISTIFRQIAFYMFERDLHSMYREKGYVSRDDISMLFCKNMKAYLGDSVLEDDGMRYGWIYWSHLRRYFYVYSYASGLLISKALQSMVRSNIKNVSLIKDFLSSGSSISPLELFNTLGIDISKRDIWEKGIGKIRDDFRTIQN